VAKSDPKEVRGAGGDDLELDAVLAMLATLAEIGTSIEVGIGSIEPASHPALGPEAQSVEPSRLHVVEARYRALIEQIPAVTFVASLAGGRNEIYVSPQIEGLLGFDQEEWTSDPILWYRQIHPDDRQGLSLEFAASCMSGRPFKQVVRVLTRAGEVVWVHAEARFVRDEQGRLLFLQGIGFDITEQHRAQEKLMQERAARAEADRERARLREMFTGLPAAVSVLRGPTYRIEFLNPIAAEVAGAERDVTGEPLCDAFPELFERVAPVLDEVRATGEPFVAKEISVRPPGQPAGQPPGQEGERWFHLTCQPLHDRRGRVDALLLHAVDVTQEVLARRQVEEALQLREDFVSVAAHELRNPVNGLKLAFQVLRLHLAGAPVGGMPPDPTRWLDKIDVQIERLMRLIEGLLDVSRITAGRLHLELERVDLVEVAREVVERSTSGMDPGRSALRAAGPVVGTWDRLRLEQIVTDLVTNAIKYGAEKPIEIAVERNGQIARLSVLDRGIGLTPEDQARIFQKFERAAPLRRHGGLGLGLWITHQIVEALGGRIAVESRPGSGSLFTVELPLESAR
jgi:PAS domain S-box-containing protein